MDNIQKVLLGVLGTAGLLAMLTPSDVSVAPAAPEPVAVNPQPVNQVTLDGALPEESYEETDEEIVKFGEPMIDGNPIGDEEAPQQQNPDNPDQSSSIVSGNGTIDYQQILDNATQGTYGNVQPYQPAIPNLTPLEAGPIEN